MYVQKQCRAGLPADRTPWANIEPLLVTAIGDFLSEDSTQELFKMEAHEDELTSDLKEHVKTQIASLHGARVWNVATNHNKVLRNKKTKKQPTAYLLEAIERFATIHAGEESDFQGYLTRFKVNNADPTKDDFELAKAAIREGSRKVRGDTTWKNPTKPDLIIHELGCFDLEHNLVALEIKPKWSKMPHLSLVDLARVKAFTTAKDWPDNAVLPTYQFGLFLYFTEDGLENGWRFENGIEDPVRFNV